MTTNEAAERLHAIVGTRVESTLLDEALAAERRATVERIRERLGKADGPVENRTAVWYSHVSQILDEEASR
jgi:hypothetical protein